MSETGNFTHLVNSGSAGILIKITLTLSYISYSQNTSHFKRVFVILLSDILIYIYSINN